MPGIMRPEIGNLTFYPSIAVLALDMRAHRRHQIVHRPYAAIGRLETESELAGRRHCVEFNARAVSIQHSVFSQSRTLLSRGTRRNEYRHSCEEAPVLLPHERDARAHITSLRGAQRNLQPSGFFLQAIC